MADVFLCDNFLELTATPVPDSSAATGKWETNSLATIPTPYDPVNYIDDLEPGENTFVWVLESADCQRYDSAVVVVYYEPVPQTQTDQYDFFNNQGIENNFTDNDIFDENNDAINLLYTPNILGFNDLGNGEFQFYPPGWFTGKDSLMYEICPPNCPDIYCDTAIVQFNVLPANDRPNVITPNGDLYNPCFVITELEDNPDLYPNNKLVIINQAGDVVYQTMNYKNDWAGTNKNGQPLPATTYYYFFDFGTGISINGEILIIKD